MSEDYLSLRLARLGAQLEAGPEVKAAGGKKKVKPLPPWLADDAEDDDTSDAEDEPRRSRRKPPRGAKPAGMKAAARPTVWGPPKKRVDITRARGDGVMDVSASDARVRREARQRFYDGGAKPGRGRAGGNGVTAGRSNGAAVARVPGNVRRRGRGQSQDHPYGEMGEGLRWGRSGSAIKPHKPANIRKGLYDYSEDEIERAMSVASKALNGVLGQLRDR